MTTLCDAVPQDQLLTLAVAVKSPTVLAQTFAAYVGQFYDRTAFDALARQAADLYALDNAERAARFRAHLDRRLCDRYHTPPASACTSPAAAPRRVWPPSPPPTTPPCPPPATAGPST